MTRIKRTTRSQNIKINRALTNTIISKLAQDIANNKNDFERSKIIARDYLGSRKYRDNKVLICFWIPGLKDALLKDKQLLFKLELLTPLENIDFQTLNKGDSKHIKFIKDLIQLETVDDYLIGILDNVKIGSKEETGSFYWLKYFCDNDNEYIIRDPLVQSCPLGIYAPAEVYDIAGMLKKRTDLNYFKTFYKKELPDGSLRCNDIGITLEIHVETATKEGTLSALTNIYKEIGVKIQKNIDEKSKDVFETLTPPELNFICFDTIELTPEVPPVEREGIESSTGEFFNIISEDDNVLTVEIKKPDISNWGYDTPLIGTAAINPSILQTSRPDEFLDFIETIHNLPFKPIQLSFDAVLGHADFQGARLLRTFDAESVYPDNLKYMNSKFFRGPNMYGRDINFAEPQVRAILLEMYQRKVNLGFDCIRVDGGQDFVKEVDPETLFRIQDDEFINEMVNVIQDINGIKRRLDLNVEDGRPWPNDLNWLYNATYCEHYLERTIPYGEKVKQWGPLIFAHNVPGKFKWFQVKWDRFKDTFKEGANWITGLSNHDNARYFYRLVNTRPSSEFKKGDSFDNYYNDQLGESYPEVIHNALDNTALAGISLAFLPGSPMFFLNSFFNTPWLFFRDIDKQYGVKVVADEGSRFLTWYIDDELYNNPDNFKKLKKLGFKKLNQLVTKSFKKKKPGFMDYLFEKHEQIKTDPVILLYLYDNPEQLGAYKNIDDIEAKIVDLMAPDNKKKQKYVEFLENRIESDIIEAARKINFARRIIINSINQYEKEFESLSKKQKSYQKKILKKLHYLNDLIDEPNQRAISLLLEDASIQNEYNIAKWAEDNKLNKLAPEEMKIKGQITEQKLIEFALAFMKDAKDVSKVHKYMDSINYDRVKYNLDLRKFRNQNNWLIDNPTNDISLDFFNRKIIANGAKDLGAFFSDKGDIVNSNTIYYGWRTSPCKSKQVFIIANMEGKPLRRLAINQFLPVNDKWEVIIQSPSLKIKKKHIDKSFIFNNFKNGDTLILSRNLN